MDVDRIRHLYEYHFTLNRRFWNFCTENLSWEQMKQESEISVGSIKNQFVHLMSVDGRWFSGLKHNHDPGVIKPEQIEDAEELRLRWDLVEAEMRIFLDGLTENQLERQFDEKTKVWHVLSHVVNHGTAHRAQIGAMLKLLGFQPPGQDYIFFVMGKI